MKVDPLIRKFCFSRCCAIPKKPNSDERKKFSTSNRRKFALEAKFFLELRSLNAVPKSSKAIKPYIPSRLKLSGCPIVEPQYEAPMYEAQHEAKLNAKETYE